jgi:hypothetical protein
MELNNTLSLIAQALLIIALPIVIAAAFQTFRAQSEKLKGRMGEDQFNMLKQLAQTGVKLAEQSGLVDQLTGPEKRDKAIAFVQGWLQQHNVNIDVSKIADVVEAEVNNQFKNPSAPVDSAEARQALIDKAVESAVLAAEQSGLHGIIQNMGPEKKAYAMQMAKEYMKMHGISIPDNLVDGLIEAQLLRFTLAARGQLPTQQAPAAPAQPRG